jgi:hypothetical protein
MAATLHRDDLLDRHDVPADFRRIVPRSFD